MNQEKTNKIRENLNIEQYTRLLIQQFKEWRLQNIGVSFVESQIITMSNSYPLSKAATVRWEGQGIAKVKEHGWESEEENGSLWLNSTSGPKWKQNHYSFGPTNSKYKPC